MAFEFYANGDLTQPQICEITDFLDSQETSHLFQFPQWSVAGERFALLRESGKILWFGTFGIYRPLGLFLPWLRAAIANRGPVCDDHRLWQSATEAFIEQLRQEGVTYFDAMPDWVRTPETDLENGLRRSGWQEQGGERTSLRLDLTRSEDEIFANFRKNSRYEVRRAERLGVSVTAGSSDAEIEEFLSLHARLAARKGFAAETRDDLRSAIGWLTKADSRGALLLARAESQVYGGAVIGRSGSRCWYVWGAAENHEHYHVGHVLQWKALLWARSHGCKEYDFGGYVPGATSGPGWFKAGFGGRVVQFVRPHRKVIRRGHYRTFDLICRMRNFSTGRWVVRGPARDAVPAGASAEK
jgi:hypothetical protein